MIYRGESNPERKVARAVRTELINMLREDVSSVITRERSAFDTLVGSRHTDLVLCGAGFIGRKVLAVLHRKGITPLAFADNCRGKWGTAIDDVPVLSPSEAVQRHGSHAAFIVTVWSNIHCFLDIKRQLTNLKCRHVVPFPALAWKYPEDFLPYYQLDLPHKIIEHSTEVISAFDLLSDNESRSHYLAYLRFLLLLDFEGLPVPSPGDQYFPSDIITLSPGENFIDCGAFDGDTIRAFLQRVGSEFKGVIAYEPDPLNYVKLCSYTSSLPENIKRRIDVRKAALGAARSTVAFSGSGSMASAVSSGGSYVVDIVSLDDDLSGVAPTFIKFDIEGSELDALMGAQDIIHANHPLIAANVYHNQQDIWKIPIYMYSLHAGYRFYLRSHRADGWETVLYAVPPGRVCARAVGMS